MFRSVTHDAGNLSGVLLLFFSFFFGLVLIDTKFTIAPLLAKQHWITWVTNHKDPLTTDNIDMIIKVQNSVNIWRDIPYLRLWGSPPLYSISRPTHHFGFCVLLHQNQQQGIVYDIPQKYGPVGIFIVLIWYHLCFVNPYQVIVHKTIHISLVLSSLVICTLLQEQRRISYGSNWPGPICDLI